MSAAKILAALFSNGESAGTGVLLRGDSGGDTGGIGDMEAEVLLEIISSLPKSV